MVAKNLWRFLNFTQYGIIFFIGLMALLDIEFLSLGWWLAAAGNIALLVLTKLSDLDRLNDHIFVWSEAVLIAGMVFLSPFYMILGFSLASHASFIYPIQQAVYPIGLAVLATVASLVRLDGWVSGLLGGLTSAFGFFSFASFNLLRRREEEKHHETRRLLDELRVAHHQLEVYAEQIQEMAIVEERNRLARELHDSVKQQAFAVSAQLAAARTKLGQHPGDAEEHLLAAETLMDEIRRELAQLIHELRPVALQDRGLAPALRDWSAEWSRSSGIPVEISVQGERGLPLEVEKALFRIVQEALSNISRHSRANNASVHLRYSPTGVLMCIRDNGQGFDANLPGDGIGLRSMRERAESLSDGRFTLRSIPGSGTEIEVQCSG